MTISNDDDAAKAIVKLMEVMEPGAGPVDGGLPKERQERIKKYRELIRRGQDELKAEKLLDE